MSNSVSKSRIFSSNVFKDLQFELESENFYFLYQITQNSLIN